jgi:hypothetical protein
MQPPRARTIIAWRGAGVNQISGQMDGAVNDHQLAELKDSWSDAG